MVISPTQLTVNCSSLRWALLLMLFSFSFSRLGGGHQGRWEGDGGRGLLCQRLTGPIWQTVLHLLQNTCRAGRCLPTETSNTDRETAQNHSGRRRLSP